MMRRINCGHTVHESCLSYMISKDEYACPFDDIPIAPGLYEILKIKIVKITKESKIDENTVAS